MRISVSSSLREALSLFNGVLALFFWAALLTFDAVRPDHNLCGRWGGQFAFWAWNGLGWAAIVLPGFAVALSVGCYRWPLGKWAPSFWMRWSGGLLLLVCTSALLGLMQTPTEFAGDAFLAGGAWGAWVAQGLLPEFNFFGSALLLGFLWVGLVSWVTPFPLLSWVFQGLRWAREMVAHSFSWKFLRPWEGFSFSPFFQKGILWVQQRARGWRGAAEELQKRASPEEQPIAPLNRASFDRFKAAEEPPSLPLPFEVYEEEPSPLLQKSAKEFEPPSSDSFWKLPEVDFLKDKMALEIPLDRSQWLENSQILQQKFADFGIQGEVVAVRPGPVITLYEFRPGPGVKVSRIAALADDLSMALSAESVRILAPLPGKSVVGIEIPNAHREKVLLKEFLQHPDFYGPKHQIPVIMGKDIGGQPFISDLGRMPHLLCAGQTGSGKSVFMTSLICSLLYRFTPRDLRLLLVDPKFIEFRAYQDLPHLLLPVVDDAKQASLALKWAVQEMERRYRILAQVGARNLASFHQKLEEGGVGPVADLLRTEADPDWMEVFEKSKDGVPQVGRLPYLVIIIDELADLMMIARKEVEISIARLAQKARAAGIHLVIATQRPSTDVITGLIKANLPSRVSFQLASYIDSKTILDRAGAERLLGQGDMLFIPPGVSQPVRLHGAYVEDSEIEKITAFLKAQGQPIYREEILLNEDSKDDLDGDEDDQDEFLAEAIDWVRRSQHASASALQRHFKIGYNRAARMIELMEKQGMVGPQEGARPREIFLK